MTKSIIETIRAEIERLRKENGKDGRPSHVTEVICTHLLSFIDSLPEEPLIPSNSVGLEEAAKDYAILPMDVGDGLVCIDRKKERAFIAGAEWGIKSQEKKIADAYEKGKQEVIRIVRSWESNPGQCGY